MPNTPRGRVSFPSVFTATETPNGDKKFQLTLIFDKDDPGLPKLEAEVEECMKRKWGKKPAKYKSPFLDGDEDGKPEYKGKTFIRLSSKADRRPGVVDQDREPIEASDGSFYSGCYARASYNLYGWEYMGKHGVSFGLKNVQKMADGEPLDGRTKPEDDFDDLSAEDVF